MGVPVAILGVIFFVVVGLMVALAPKPRLTTAGKKGRAAEPAGVAGENVAAYVFALSAIGLVFTLYLAWASLVPAAGVVPALRGRPTPPSSDFSSSHGGRHQCRMTTLPGRAVRDSVGAREEPGRAHRHRVAAGGRGGSWWRRFRTERQACRRDRRPRRPSPGVPAADRRTARAIRGVVQRAAGRRGADRQGRREGADREVQRFPVPAVPSDLQRVQGHPGEVHGRPAP